MVVWPSFTVTLSLLGAAVADVFGGRVTQARDFVLYFYYGGMLLAALKQVTLQRFTLQLFTLRLFTLRLFTLRVVEGHACRRMPGPDAVLVCDVRVLVCVFKAALDMFHLAFTMPCQCERPAPLRSCVCGSSQLRTWLFTQSVERDRSRVLQKVRPRLAHRPRRGTTLLVLLPRPGSTDSIIGYAQTGHGIERAEADLTWYCRCSRCPSTRSTWYSRLSPTRALDHVWYWRSVCCYNCTRSCLVLRLLARAELAHAY
eukprot:814142-Rhodomonas_salina.1